jgi:hypothetical protein
MFFVAVAVNGRFPGGFSPQGINGLDLGVNEIVNIKQ